MQGELGSFKASVTQGHRFGPWSEMRERKGPPLPHRMASEWSWPAVIQPSWREVLGPPQGETPWFLTETTTAPSVQVGARNDYPRAARECMDRPLLMRFKWGLPWDISIQRYPRLRNRLWHQDN
ncbi:hypothetical protein BGZ90_009291 [Linnemannia elongata]|nr:hypothetical protein BGZ90_009291 [Linnemannia elongata]